MSKYKLTERQEACIRALQPLVDCFGLYAVEQALLKLQQVDKSVDRFANLVDDDDEYVQMLMDRDMGD